jgi:hypothetical protein
MKVNGSTVSGGANDLNGADKISADLENPSHAEMAVSGDFGTVPHNCQRQLCAATRRSQF